MTIVPEALEVGNVIKASATVDLIINIIIELFIQSDEILPNQATAPCCQGTHVRQSTRHAVKAAESRQRKQVRMA